MERLGWEERDVVNGWQVFERFRSEGAERVGQGCVSTIGRLGSVRLSLRRLSKRGLTCARAVAELTWM